MIHDIFLPAISLAASCKFPEREKDESEDIYPRREEIIPSSWF
jgi:hypothetical protein